MKKEHIEIMMLLKTAKGQLEHVIKMVDEEKYCINISNQILAVESLVKRANNQLLVNHLKNCVKSSDANQIDAKLDELVKIITKINK